VTQRSYIKMKESSDLKTAVLIR